MYNEMTYANMSHFHDLYFQCKTKGTVSNSISKHLIIVGIAFHFIYDQSFSHKHNVSKFYRTSDVLIPKVVEINSFFLRIQFTFEEQCSSYFTTNR